MTAALLITSAQNPRVKHLAKLRDRRGRDQSGQTVLEGYRLLSRAVEAGWPIDECYFCPAFFLGENEPALLELVQSRGAQLFELPEHLFQKAAYRERPEGLLAITPVRDNDLAKFPVKANGLYLVAEAVEKPGNLGSLLRSADASGVAGLLLCDKRTDLYNPNTLTASTGAIFHVPIAECPSPEALAWLRAQGVATLAATPHTDKAYYDVDLTGPVAVVVGAEQYGLSDFWMDNADLKVAIPMLGKIDSLNVAIATSVLLFEAARQRAAGHKKQ